MIKLNPALRANREFQSALVRMGFWVFGASYVGGAGYWGYYPLDWGTFFLLCGVYLVFFTGMLISVLLRPEWTARQFLGIVLDITAVSHAIYLTGKVSPFYLIYIWVFIYAGTRYGRAHLVFASAASLAACTLTLIVLDTWGTYPFESAFFLLLLIVLPMYQHSLLHRLQEARQEAEVANQAKGNFLAMMTHELRTPLTGVVDMTNLLQSTKLDDEQREYVDSIATSAEVLRALIGDVLDLSKIDARKLHLESIAFDLRTAMLEVCTALVTQALAKGLELLLRVDQKIPDKLIGDQLRVRQILYNLIGNAIKFTDQGEIRVRAGSCPFGWGMPRPHLLLEVEDTGIGIAEDQLEEIFEGFRQADDSTYRRYGGTGLGTTIARDLTHLMGGRIGVESKVGKGSRFWVRLPLQQEARTPGAMGGVPRLGGLHALVFEANATGRELIMESLQDAGMKCEPLLDISHLSRMTGRTRKVDLLIVADSPDRQDLPALLDLFHRVLGADLPSLLLTYGARRIDQAATDRSCLNKPFLAEDLVERVRQVLGEAQPEIERQESAETSTQEAPAPGLRILVAEDNAIAGKVIRALLEKQGCEVTLVSDGEQALSRALAEPFALALVDLRMPKLDGASFARAYRASEKEGRQLPIVALTASASEDAKNRCLDAGMDNFLAKPVNPRELGKMVEHYADLGRDTSSCRRRIEAQGTMSDGDERVDPSR